LHVIQRGNNREAIFFAEDACTRDWLGAAVAEYGCAIHPSWLMTNPMYLLVTPGGPQSLPRTMQSLGRRTFRHVDTRYRRTMIAREGRYRAAPIDSEACFLACCRTIELDPVRAAWSGIPAVMNATLDRWPSGHFQSEHHSGRRWHDLLSEHEYCLAKCKKNSPFSRFCFANWLSSPLSSRTRSVRAASSTGHVSTA
jgi:putative transposase